MIGNYSAVSWRAMAVRRSVFEKIGGFRADDFPDELFDVDLCLRLWQRGLRVVYTPYAVLRDTSDAEEGHSPSALARLSELWPAEIERDRFYNPNLSLAGEPFEIDA